MRANAEPGPVAKSVVRRFWFLFVLLGGFAICGGLGYREYRPVWQFSHLKRVIETDLPPGTPRADAEQWFAARHIKTSAIAEKESGRVGGLGARIPSNTILENADIWIELYFDANDRLEKSVIDRCVVPIF